MKTSAEQRKQCRIDAEREFGFAVWTAEFCRDVLDDFAHLESRVLRLRGSLKEFIDELPPDRCPSPTCGGECAIRKRADAFLAEDAEEVGCGPNCVSYEAGDSFAISHADDCPHK